VAVVTGSALRRVDVLVRRILLDVLRRMTIVAECLLSGNKEKPVWRTMGIVADNAPSGDKRPVNIFLVHLKDMTLQTELPHRQQQRVACGVVTAVTHLGCIRPVHRAVACRPGTPGFPASLFTGRPRCLLLRFGHAVKEEAEHLVARLRRGWRQGIEGKGSLLARWCHGPILRRTARKRDRDNQ
jgi:hypothetical protein